MSPTAPLKPKATAMATGETRVFQLNFHDRRTAEPVPRRIPMIRRQDARGAGRVAPLLGLALLVGCQQPGGGQGLGFNDAQGPGEAHSGQVSPLLGTVGGAGAGALLGRILAGKHDNTAAIVGGALLGAPVAGAAVGAGVGTVRGGSKQKQANASAQDQAAAEAVARQKKAYQREKAAYDKEMESFKRAFGACLDARGYSVK